ncbi:homeobox protein dve-1 isoform X1 [Neodiprion pinetum]|uniref:Homeobox protein dve-1 isoform X1 n=1 Tax=Neodiprion lecontei TaxID=441921 RepID=A0ABM3FYV2_NEOLC|nr:homeobox protein dve-1 isoform X1 [Neodiprion pinetum]XP_046593207.1 homeobox protein dve-1 isoform X1 [Neodiprion lecontei]
MLANLLITSAASPASKYLYRPHIDLTSSNQPSQALALTHKASPPSRPCSVSSLPKSPQSHQSRQSQPHNIPQPSIAHQSQTPLSTPQTPFSAHSQHSKPEVNASPKQEGFDLSKSATGKSLPVHCVVEAIHSIVESRVSSGRENWRRPQVETDSYVIIPAATAFQDLVGVALVRLGYPADLTPSARGSIVIRNWKPLPLEKVADGPLLTVGDILAELTTVATLRIQVYRSRPPPPSPAAEVRSKLLRLLLLHSHALLISAGCPLDEMTLSSLCGGGNDLSEETRRSFESWLQQQQLGLGLNPMMPSGNHHPQSPQPEVGPLGPGGPIGPPHPAMMPFSHKTRMRTSFDPELELPRLQRWFGENQHPSRQQIQHYVSELNSLESRRGRKLLDVNNVVYWFKNARAAQKRAETRSVNGYSPPGLSPRGASMVSEDCSDEEDDSRHQSTSPSPCPPPSPPVGPLSLTTRPEDQQPPSSTPSSVKQEDARASSGSEDEEPHPTGPIPSGFPLVPSPMFGHSIMYMHYLPPRGPTGCPASLLDERRKRNRTFIDPVTEVPRLEGWFTLNTHPSHALILKYTEELNRMPYRQKFPRLEPKNVQFWFKNRRAKCKRLKMALFEGESPQPHPYHAD